MSVRSKGAHRRTRRARVNPLALVVTSVAVVAGLVFGVSMGFSPAASVSPGHSAVLAVVPSGGYTFPSSTPALYISADPIVKPTFRPASRPTVQPSRTVTPARVVAPPTAPPTSFPTIPSGTLSCAGLEALWDDAGGNPAHAYTAARIAMAESGGNQYAHSPTNDYGYWQINGSNNGLHGIIVSYKPLQNARDAIILSYDGTDWNAWTTYQSGAYRNKC